MCGLVVQQADHFYQHDSPLGMNRPPKFFHHLTVSCRVDGLTAYEMCYPVRTSEPTPHQGKKSAYTLSIFLDIFGQ